MVRLYHEDGSAYSHKVAQLVLEAFVGPQPVGMESCHADGVRTNNVALNLRWDTHDNNILERNAHQGFVRLIAGDAERIKDLLSCGVSQREIADHFGISQTTVSQINLGRAWKLAA